MTNANDETRILCALGRLFRRRDANRFLLGAAHALRRVLQENPKVNMTQASIPLELFGRPLPGGVKSGWVFVLRKGVAFPAERHSNSIQRMFALDCAGAMEVWEGRWRGHELYPTAEDPGLSIPAGTWHRPALTAADWAVASFHTVPANELLEELGDPAAGKVSSRRAYEQVGA